MSLFNTDPPESQYKKVLFAEDDNSWIKIYRGMVYVSFAGVYLKDSTASANGIIQNVPKAASRALCILINIGQAPDFNLNQLCYAYIDRNDTNIQISTNQFGNNTRLYGQLIYPVYDPTWYN